MNRQNSRPSRKRKPGAKPGFGIYKANHSVAGEDGAGPAEPVVQTGADDVILLAVIHGETRQAARSQVRPVVAAEIGKEILDLDAPVRGEGVFDTGADGISDPHVVAVVGGEEG